MDYIQLGTADLAANRDGMLSEAQTALLRRQRQLRMAGTLALILLLAALGIVIWLKWRHPAFAARGQLFLVLPLLLFWLWLLRSHPGQWRRLNLDLRQGHVVNTEGKLYTDFHLGLGLVRPIHYRVQVGEQIFRISKNVFRRLRPGEHYRVYHARHSGTFLGALPLATLPKTTAQEDHPTASLLEPLTQREAEVLKLIAGGLSNQEIADQLHLSINTVKMYASQLYRKLRVSRRTEAVARARDLDLL